MCPRSLGRAVSVALDIVGNLRHDLLGVDHFRIEQCSTCPIPGYLIISPVIQVKSLSEMGPAALSELGPTLAIVTQAIDAILKPDRIYCAMFGEKDNLIHFHIFPRTKWILDEYLKENPMTAEVVSGPQVLDWSRENFKKDSIMHLPGPGKEEIIDKLRKFFKSI